MYTLLWLTRTRNAEGSLTAAAATVYKYISNGDGQTQDCGNSSANALELPQSCAKPSMYCVMHKCHEYVTAVNNNGAATSSQCYCGIMC